MDDKALKILEAGLSHATRKRVVFQTVESIGPVRSFAQIRKDEARLRVALEEITRCTEADEMTLIARRALNV